MKIDLHHEINHDPEPDDAGTIKVTARIFGESDYPTFTTVSLAKEFIDPDNDECRSKQDLNYFLIDAGVDDNVTCDAINNLIDFVDEITCGTSNGYYPECALEVNLELCPAYLFDDDDNDEVEDTDMEEAIRESFDLTSNIRFRPAKKLVVKSLTRRIYKKIVKKKKKETKIISSIDDEQCSICLEEFTNGVRLVTLPCGHDFDGECIEKWFETSHVCPLCRFELPPEDQ